MYRSVLAAIVLMLAGGVALADNSECWKEGYEKGVCDARGQNNCLPPLAPLPPLPPLGRDDCKSRFADGYRAGLAAGSRGY